MSALLRKELRSILPAWVVAMVLATLPVWLVWPGPNEAMFQSLGITVFGPFGLGVLLLSLTPFGQELNWGTFQVLLSQPVSRRRLWFTKVSIVAVALGLAFLALCISNHFRVDSVLESMKQTVWRNAFERPGQENRYFAQLIADTRRAASQDTILIGGLEVLAGFAGGLWTTLLFRQVTAAFWLTFLIPMGLSVVASMFLKNVPDNVGRISLALILGSYSAAGFLWAKRFFLRVEDTQWTGGVIALPNFGELTAGQEPSLSRRSRRPLRALWRKEFQAQQINLLLACGLLLVHLGVVVFRRVSVEYLATHQSVAMTLEMVPLLWLVMPLLIGSVAVAEERKMGTFQSNLCLPASRRSQFLAKLGVTFLLALILGGIVPLLVERLAPYRSGVPNPTDVAFLGGNRPLDSLQLIGSVAITVLAFYGSTLTRNALQAMGAGLLGAVFTGLLIFLIQRAGDFPELILWRGPLIGLIGFPVMIFTIFFLAYRNYTQLQPNVRVWLRNGLVLLAAFLGSAFVTTIIFHRAWEAWMPEEPLHSFRAFMDQFPAGPKPVSKPNRSNSGYLGLQVQELSPTLAKELGVEPTAGVLVANVTAESPAEQAGIRKKDVVRWFDGRSFSNSQELAQAVAKSKPGSTVPIEVLRSGSNLTLEVTVARMPDLMRVPQHRRSSPKIIAAGSQKAIVFPDGRLWLQHHQARLYKQRVNNQGVVIWYKVGPQHTGFVDGSEWRDVALNQGGCVGVQEDGTLWDLSESGFGGTNKLISQDKDWESISAGSQYFSALKLNGTIWQWGLRQTQSGPEQIPLTQVGTDTDWTAVCDSWITAGVKSDGSVWRWDWRKPSDGPQPWLAGACGEPVSLTTRGHAVAMVCADGTLWIGGEDLTNSVYTRFLGGAEGQRAAREMVRWRGDYDWKQIQFVGWGRAVGLKRDGTMWEWSVDYAFGPNMGWAIPPSFPSQYADWISVAEDDNAYLALARDGTLCLWGDPQGAWFNHWQGFIPSGHSLLMPSRIKARRVAEFLR